jgi:hypothetical protein
MKAKHARQIRQGIWLANMDPRDAMLMLLTHRVSELTLKTMKRHRREYP